MAFYVTPIIAQRLDGFRIFVDPGHGGNNVGTPGYHGLTLEEDNIFEKDINLEVGLELFSILESAGANVLMSRTSDRFVANVDRGIIASEFGADLYISIHHNATDDNTVQGTEALYPPRQDGRLSQLLANYVSIKLQTNNRGIKERDNLAIFNSIDTNIPIALIEVAFISNPVEEEMMMKQFNQRFAAEGIFLAIREFLLTQRRLF